jgi:hypothetical protein
MLLQPHEIRAPIPAVIIPGDLVQWAGWYMQHLLNGGRRLDGSRQTYSVPYWRPREKERRGLSIQRKHSYQFPQTERRFTLRRGG